MMSQQCWSPLILQRYLRVTWHKTSNFFFSDVISKQGQLSMSDNLYCSSSHYCTCWFLDVWYKQNTALKCMQPKNPLTLISTDNFNVRISSSCDKASLVENQGWDYCFTIVSFFTRWPLNQRGKTWPNEYLSTFQSMCTWKTNLNGKRFM